MGYMYIYIYIYIHCGSSLRNSQTRLFVNRTYVRFPKQSFANQYWLVYEAITKLIYLVSEGVIDHKKNLLIITILLHLNNICLGEIYITLLEKLLYWVHVYRHFYFYNYAVNTIIVYHFCILFLVFKNKSMYTHQLILYSDMTSRRSRKNKSIYYYLPTQFKNMENVKI